MLPKQFLRMLALPLCACLVTSCQQQLDEAAFLAYIHNPDNGLYQQQTVEGVEVSIQYRPTEILIAQELKNNPQSGSNLDSLRKMYNSKLHFTLSFSKDEQEVENQFLPDRSQYNQAIQYLSYGLANNISLVSSSDTIRPLGYVYPRMYSTTGRSSMFVVFDRDQLKEETGKFYILLQDTQLGLGMLVYPFRQRDLDNIPTIRPSQQGEL